METLESRHGVFLSASSGCPARARAGQFRALAEGLTSPRQHSRCLHLRQVLPFVSKLETTPALLQSLKWRRVRPPSPQRRIVLLLSPEAYREDLPPWDGAGSSPVMARYHFLQAPTRITPRSRCRYPHIRLQREVRGPPQRFTQGRWLARPEGLNADSRSPPAWPLRHGSFFRTPRWTRPGCVPPRLCGVRAGGSVRARTRTGRLWRLCWLPLSCLASPFRFMLDLVPSHCGSRTPEGLYM